ncbi:hypothetical protein CALCODRAFT_509855 [Calocera cornea HHB12733]|uniref:Uncharacterized protein n=1 Tax=Calocera cornea HHB12733 TaxID=1353952 RepID=A0A165EYL4_9BASI|nr:hypothetical protein CALCODRAFT_509855 [Calocera cornea HHB12733]
MRKPKTAEDARGLAEPPWSLRRRPIAPNISLNLTGQHSSTTHYAHRLRMGLAADNAAISSTGFAAPADTVNANYFGRHSSTTQGASSAKIGTALISLSPINISKSSSTATTVSEDAVVLVAANGPALAPSCELINGQTDTAPASPPLSYALIPSDSNASRLTPSDSSTSASRPIPSNSSTPASCPIPSDSSQSGTLASRLIPSDSIAYGLVSTGPSTNINALIADDSAVQDDSTTGEDLPRYTRWEDIPPFYATLRVPAEFASASSTPTLSVLSTPTQSPSYPSSPNPGAATVLRPLTPPSPTSSRASKRRPFRKRFNMSPKALEAALEAAARREARKEVQGELDRAGFGWAGPLARGAARNVS